MIPLASFGGISMLVVTILLAAASQPTAEQLLATYRQATTVAVRCPVEAAPGEVVVCGRRRADRYRLPFNDSDGGTRLDPTTAEREALLVPPAPWQQMGPFLVGGGAFGAHASVSDDGKVRLRLRELSP